MDFTLKLAYQEQNDNKAIVLTDTSNVNDSEANITGAAGDSLILNDMYEIVADGGNGTFTGSGSDSVVVGSRFYATAATALGAGDIAKPVTPKATEITAGTIDITVTNKASVEDIKTQVNIYTEFGPFGSQNDMVYTITALLLGDSSGSLLVDGLYEITYALTGTAPNGGTRNYSVVVTILVYGQVKVATYTKLKNISTIYMCDGGAVKSDIAEADLCGAYLSSIENSAYVAKTEELLSMLTVLDSIIKNGSNITW